MRAQAEDEDGALRRESEKTNRLEEQAGREEAAAVWATQLSRTRNASRPRCNGVRFSTCVSRSDAGQRRNTGLIQNFAAKSNLRNCLAFFPSLSHPALYFFPLFHSLCPKLQTSIREEKQMRARQALPGSSPIKCV